MPSGSASPSRPPTGCCARWSSTTWWRRIRPAASTASGPGVLQLGNAYLDGSELRARSLLWAESLAQRTNEAVWVATLSGTRVIVLHHVFRPDNTVQILEVGAAIPWHACALGHAIVAYLPASSRRG